MEDPRNTRDITDGFEDDVLEGIPAHQRDVIFTLLARVSERSYRRGFQQGESISRRRPEAIRKDLAQWRYGQSVDDSPMADQGVIETSADRLLVENKGLSRLGLLCPVYDAIMPSPRRDPTYVPRGVDRKSKA